MLFKNSLKKQANKKTQTHHFKWWVQQDSNYVFYPNNRKGFKIKAIYIYTYQYVL